jgi:hypothetical protein
MIAWTQNKKLFLSNWNRFEKKVQIIRAKKVLAEIPDSIIHPTEISQKRNSTVSAKLKLSNCKELEITITKNIKYPLNLRSSIHQTSYIKIRRILKEKLRASKA